MLAALLLALLEEPKQLVTDIQARIPKTPLVLSLQLSEWKENKEQAIMARSDVARHLAANRRAFKSFARA